jgi:hypothetical protein
LVAPALPPALLSIHHQHAYPSTLFSGTTGSDSRSTTPQFANLAEKAAKDAAKKASGWVAHDALRKDAAKGEELYEVTKGLIQQTGEETGKAKGLKKFFANFVAMDESAAGASIVLFIQDTMAVWLPKMLVVRSLAEGIEATFLEFVESGLFYFTAPLLGEHVFSHMMHKRLGDNAEKLADGSKNPNYIHRTDMAISMKELGEKVDLDKLSKEFSHGIGNKVVGQQAKKIVALKLATILATMSVVTMEYSLSFVKNLLTLGLFKTGDFNEVANLNTGKIKNKEELEATEKTRKKSIRRLGEALAIAGAFMASGIYVAKKGPNSKKIFDFGRKVLKGFKTTSKTGKETWWGADFKYSHVLKRKTAGFRKSLTNIFTKREKPPEFVKNKDGLEAGKNKLIAKFGLSGAQKYFIIAAGGLSYLDATRNKLELVETAARVWLVTVPYLTIGNDLIKGFQQRLFHGDVDLPWLLKWMKPSDKTIERHRQIAEVGKDGKRTGYKTLPEITKMALERAGVKENVLNEPPSPMKAFKWVNSNDPKLRKAGQEFWKLMLPKITSVILPLGFGMSVAGFAVAKLNRYWTQVRYDRGVNDQMKERFQRIESGLQRAAQPPRQLLQASAQS